MQKKIIIPLEPNVFVYGAIALFVANTMNAHFPDHFYRHASGITIKLCILSSNFHLPIYLGYSLAVGMVNVLTCTTIPINGQSGASLSLTCSRPDIMASPLEFIA